MRKPAARPSEKHIRAFSAEDYAANIADAADRLRFQTEFSQSALKNLHLVNGGAIIALLTFIGNSSATFGERSMWWAFFWFASGLGSSLIAYFGAYFSQVAFMEVSLKLAWNAQRRSVGVEEVYDFKPDFALGNRALYFGISAAVASLMSFVVGSFVALGGLL